MRYSGPCQPYWARRGGGASRREGASLTDPDSRSGRTRAARRLAPCGLRVVPSWLDGLPKHDDIERPLSWSRDRSSTLGHCDDDMRTRARYVRAANRESHADWLEGQVHCPPDRLFRSVHESDDGLFTDELASVAGLTWCEGIPLAVRQWLTARTRVSQARHRPLARAVAAQARDIGVCPDKPAQVVVSGLSGYGRQDVSAAGEHSTRCVGGSGDCCRTRPSKRRWRGL